jgi:hypothetical protein
MLGNVNDTRNFISISNFECNHRIHKKIGVLQKQQRKREANSFISFFDLIQVSLFPKNRE